MYKGCNRCVLYQIHRVKRTECNLLRKACDSSQALDKMRVSHFECGIGNKHRHSMLVKKYNRTCRVLQTRHEGPLDHQVSDVNIIGVKIQHD